LQLEESETCVALLGVLLGYRAVGCLALTRR
jgi:hypothetical protein